MSDPTATQKTVPQEVLDEIAKALPSIQTGLALLKPFIPALSGTPFAVIGGLIPFAEVAVEQIEEAINGHSPDQVASAMTQAHNKLQADTVGLIAQLAANDAAIAAEIAALPNGDNGKS